MGCDGGTIPTRGEQVRTKKKPQKVSKEDELVTKWMHCAMSQEPLKEPIVACQLGYFYNKESILSFLLDKSKAADVAEKFSHIRFRKDYRDLQLTGNPAFSSDDQATKGGKNLGASAYICPVTGLEMNGHYRFCYILSCGCVLSERAIKEIGDNGSCCIGCGAKFSKDDVIALNPVGDELERLRVKMEERRASALLEKKAKKTGGTTASCAGAGISHAAKTALVSAESASAASTSTEGKVGALPCTSDGQALTTAFIKSELEEFKESSAGEGHQELANETSPPRKRQKVTMESGESSDRQSTSSAEVKQEPEDLKHKEACRSNGKLSHDKLPPTDDATKRDSAAASSSGRIGIGLGARAKIAVHGKEKSEKPKSIQNDKSTSEVYKALFNTHASALNRPKAHWVTYNPQYN